MIDAENLRKNLDGLKKSCKIYQGSHVKAQFGELRKSNHLQDFPIFKSFLEKSFQDDKIIECEGQVENNFTPSSDIQ